MDKRYLENGYSVDIKGTVRTPKGRVLSPFVNNSNGQLRVTMKGKKYFVKQLIAQLYIEGFDKNTQKVIVVDGNPFNLHISNIAVVPRSKYRALDIEAIKERKAKGEKVKQIAEELGLSYGLLYKAINGDY